MKKKYAQVFLLAGLIVCSFATIRASAFDACITLTNGYFYDPALGKPWVPIGMAYQTWNEPLGVMQTFDQIDYDLDEMVKMGVNSVRIDMVWKQIEEAGDNQFDWARYDYFLQACEKRNLRVFALIGYQWPPDWFPDEWYTMHPPEWDAEGIWHSNRWQSDIINFEHPEARAQYAEWIDAVCSRYRTNKAIVAWIVGNEYGYLGLWSGLLDGYDPWTEQAFRQWCSNKYGTIAAANAAWGTSYTNFNQVTFPDQYRAYGVEGAIWADAVQFREDSMAGFTALSAKAARNADTNHLLSYSTVGMQWGEEDWRYHAEDRGKIAAACISTGAPLAFFSVNNYPWSVLGHESQNGHWGVSFTKKVAKMPVLYTETGFTSSETMWPGMNEYRQGPLVRNSLWESLEVGAIGTHIFTWQDRPWITDREKGFGIVYGDRNIKPAYWVCRDTYNLMEQVDIHGLLAGSQDPKPDIAFLWTAANDSQYNRYECEMQQIAGAMERLGYEPNFINLEELGAGVYTNYKVIVLPRNMRVEDVVPNSTNKTVLDFLRTVVIPKGIHVLASADLPGIQDFNGKWRAAATTELEQLFGIDASDPGGFEVPQRRRHFVSWYWQLIEVDFNSNAIGSVAGNYHYWPHVWKYNDRIRVTSGTEWAKMNTLKNRGFEDSNMSVVRWDGTWGNVEVRHNWGWQYAGSNMVQMWGDSGIWEDYPVVPFGRYTHSTYLRSNDDDPLRGGAYASVSIEWRDENGNVLGVAESERLTGSTTGQWVQFKVDAIAPSNAWTGRRIIRCGSTTNPPNLVVNGGLTGSGDAPTGWFAWGAENHDPELNVYHTTSPSWAFWWQCGIWQDVNNGFKAGDTISFGGWLSTPAADRLRNGNKNGSIQVEVYSNTTKLATYTAQPTITSNSAADEWIYSQTSFTVPAGATTLRILVRCDGNTGDGRFMADDIFLVNTSPGGSAFVDDEHVAPAVVVKDHGAGKAAIFLYSVGDMKPDGDLDGDPDVYDWQWRYDVLGAILRDYFGVQPTYTVSGTNAYLCLAEYRTLADGSTLWQVKNYLYETDKPNGGDPMTFTITSPLFNGRTVRGLLQNRIIEKVSDGTIQVTLEPDGMEMLHVYPPSTNDFIFTIKDAPSAIRPFGDKVYPVTLAFDAGDYAAFTGKLALVCVVNGSNKVVQTLTFTGSGAGTTNLYIYIPDPDLTDPSNQSTPEGGEWKFVAWAENTDGQVIGEVKEQPTQLSWGIKPTALPASLEPGQSFEMPLIWQNLYEYLPWQNTPMARNDAFPARVAVFRSTKTEAQYPGHFNRVNQVADWLESLGYSPGNPLDISFDNFRVALNSTNESGGPVVIFDDEVESGTNGWVADGLWHIAVDRAYESAHAWAYNNGTAYNTGTRNSGALITPWINLTNVTAATLKFRSWHHTEDAGTTWDTKQVQVSTDGTNWTSIAQISGPASEWSLRTADLTPFAGRLIRLRFFFDTVDALYNDYAGWYVDDVQVVGVTAPAVEVFADGMEGGTNWTASGLWRHATNRAASGQWSWVYNNGTTYNTGARNSGALTSGWIDLTDASSARLRFKSWYVTEDTGMAWDRKLVQVSTDGTNWTQVLQVSGASAQWTSQEADLSAFAGQFIRVRFFFDTIDAINNNYEGWYVDDVAITAPGGGVTAGALNENVESGTNGWVSGGLWHVADDEAWSPTHAWAYNNGSNYNTGARNSGALITPWVDLQTAIGAVLTFRSWYETEDTGTAWDRKLVQVSGDGTNWTTVLQVSDANREWTRQSVDLSAYVGQRIRVRFFFDTMDALYNQYKGWYVDDIRIATVDSDVLWADDFSEGSLSGWQRVAGAANWIVTNGALRAWRIGNSDNILAAGDAAWSNYTVSADIRYNKQGPYFNDAEIYLRFQDRDNFVKVGIRNFYGFWRLKYTVRQNTNTTAQGWIHEFRKTNSPSENVWYNLKVRCEGQEYTVYFDGEEVGSFTVTNFAGGKVGLGTMAAQLGIAEPQRGYFFIDDDEYSFWAPEGQSQLQGHPLNLDWGYLVNFYPTLILPGVYVMSDIEVSNIIMWVDARMCSLLATDGGVAMRDETGAWRPGRIESLFGVEPVISQVEGLSAATLGTNLHYVTQDHEAGANLPASGSAMAWTTPTTGRALGWVANASNIVPALLVNTLTNEPISPRKVFCFNFGADSSGQLTSSFSNIARRAFEWIRGQAHRVRIELKASVNPSEPQYDPTVASWEAWVLGGSGSNTLALTVPSSGFMSGSNFYWSIITYPWDAEDAWTAHDAFYTSLNDGPGLFTTISGTGLQILGGPNKIFGGRVWDLWMGYNVTGQPVTLTFGLKERGSWVEADNFDDGDYDGWSLQPEPNYLWTVTNGALRYTCPTNWTVSWLMRDDLDVADKNITIEYDVKYSDNQVVGGGLIYRGHILYLNPWEVRWATNAPLDLSSNTASNFSGLVTNEDGSVSYVIPVHVVVHIGSPYFTTGTWHRVRVNIRDGDPYPLSDVYVDGQAVLLMEPLKHTNWTSDSVGFLSPEHYGSVEWDNFRVTDEQYSFAHMDVSGFYMPTNDVTPFYPYVPDYDPDMWEYESSSLGGQYEWYAYLRGTDVRASSNVTLYFSPRLVVEDTNFPTVMNAGDTVAVPVEWEELPYTPAMLHLELVDPYGGALACASNYTLNTASGSAYFPITVSSQAVSSASYLWAAYIYPVGSSDPYAERLGLDDTFRFNTLGQPVGPEVQVTVAGTEMNDDVLTLYSDAGILGGTEVFTWQGGGAIFDGNYTNIAAPEGVKSFYTWGSYWQGWGIFSRELGAPAPRDMTLFSNGFVRFWYRSSSTLKVQIEGTNSSLKATKFVPSTTNQWKEVTIPLAEFSGIENINLAAVYGLFEVTAETAGEFWVDDVRWVKGVFRVYRDAGIPAGSDIITYSGGAATFDADHGDPSAPEGVKSFLTESASWVGWGVQMTNSSLDLHAFTNGMLCFWIKSTNQLKIEVEGPSGTKGTQYVPSTAGQWFQFALPIADFSGVDFSQIVSPFLVTAATGSQFYVDDVRWVMGSDANAGATRTVVYSDNGIPAGTDVYVWWASQYWSHVSASDCDGGFESSTQGAFPDSGYWYFLSENGGGTAVCSAAAAIEGSSGLRVTTASEANGTWVSAFQERAAYAGDIFNASVDIRQPSGSGWVSGSEAFLRLSFLDFWHQPLTSYTSSAKVTTAGKGWTYCPVSDKTAPLGTRFVRAELVISKPSSAGSSVADFDNLFLNQGNSFNGDFTEDPAPPEGTKVFRSYCVFWSGWGIFYTNGTANYSAYSNGYLKFWYRSAGYTKIEIQSVSGGVTNTAVGATYGPTTNEMGVVVWQAKVIPATNFSGIDFSNISSPFMVTDPEFDRTYSVDYVRWELTP